MYNINSLSLSLSLYIYIYIYIYISAINILYKVVLSYSMKSIKAKCYLYIIKTILTFNMY